MPVLLVAIHRERQTVMAELVDRVSNQVDPRAFRRCLGLFATGVTVISAMENGAPIGMTANSFSSVSVDPPLILWSVQKSSKSFPALRAADCFAVNVLASDQVPLATQFARSGTDKFATAKWQKGKIGVPLLDGVAARFECCREAVHDGGDHTIIVGRVLSFESFDRPLLVFARGRYALTTEYESGSPADFFTLHEGGNGTDEPFLRLARSAADCLSAAFEMHRASEGITYNQAQVLARVTIHPREPVEYIAKISLLALPDAQDAVIALQQLGYLASSTDGKLSVTPNGAKLQNVLINRASNFEQAYLAEFSPDDIAVARRVLLAFCENIPLNRGTVS